MTTHRDDTTGLTGDGRYPTEQDRTSPVDQLQPESAAEPSAMRTQPMAREDYPEMAEPRSDVADPVNTTRPTTEDPFAATPPGTPEAAPAEAIPSSEPHREQAQAPEPESLFAMDDLSGLRSRWDDVQAGFVDDPRQCVQKADGLVSDVVDQLTDGFAHARAQLEEQWARGEEVSTEDLRLALTRYREFFQRLLAV